jgi:hypothetical protein
MSTQAQPPAVIVAVALEEPAIRELRRLASATDVNGSVVRAIVNVKYPPAPAKKTEVPAFVPDTRSVEEKLRDAKRSVRSGL